VRALRGAELLMNTPIGEMRDLVLIQTPSRTVDDSGGEIVVYADSDPIFMAVRPLGTTEAVQMGQVNADITLVAYGHWHDLSSLSAKHRIKLVESNATFDIAGQPLNDPKRAWTRLHLVAREHD